jgi:hypothetical protein
MPAAALLSDAKGIALAGTATRPNSTNIDAVSTFRMCAPLRSGNMNVSLHPFGTHIRLFDPSLRHRKQIRNESIDLLATVGEWPLFRTAGRPESTCSFRCRSRPWTPQLGREADLRARLRRRAVRPERASIKAPADHREGRIGIIRSRPPGRPQCGFSNGPNRATLSQRSSADCPESLRDRHSRPHFSYARSRGPTARSSFKRVRCG